MTSLKTFPNPILTQKCDDVRFDVFGEEKLKKLVVDMYEIMHKNGGIGLAAPQVGLSLNIFVVDLVQPQDGYTTPKVFINPKVMTSEETSEMEEGCLSFPGITQSITRPAKVTVLAQDIDGKPFTEEATGLYAHAIMHEYEHLQGKTIYNHMSALRRDIVRRKIQKHLK